MKAKDLVAGKIYWFWEAFSTELRALTYMNKVEGRKAHRFLLTKTQVFLLHEDRFDRLYEDWGDATKAQAASLRLKADSMDRAVENRGKPLNPPNLDAWTVARGIKRLRKFGRR